jgi:hypothetical protein
MASDNFLVSETQHGGTNFPAEHPLRFREVVKVVGRTATVCDSKSGISASAPSPPHSLSIIECFWRNVAQEDGIEVTQVHAQFKGRRATQDMDFTLPELSLKLPGLFFVKLRRVLFNAQGTWQILFVEEAVVVRILSHSLLPA